MIKHELFPTLVGQFKYDQHEEFKKMFFATIFEYIKANGITDTVIGSTGEHTGHVTLHTVDQYAGLFRFASNCVREYIRELNVDDSIYDITLVKSWLNVSGAPTNIHSHADAHVVFTYYVNLPPDLQLPLRFWRTTENLNDLYYCMTEFNNKGNWNDFNCKYWSQEVKEGDLFVLPSKLKHDVAGYVQGQSEPMSSNSDELLLKRVCLAGDFLLSYKELSCNATGTQPFKNWRVF